MQCTQQWHAATVGQLHLYLMDAGESLDGFSLLRHARASGPCAPPVLQQYLLKKRTSFLPRGTRKKFKLHNSECDAHEIEEISTY